MSKNENQDFDKNLREIKELSKKLEESLEGSYTTIYKNKEKNEIQYKGGCIDNKYNGFGIKYNYYQKLEYEGFFTDGKKNGKGLLYYYNNNKIYFNGIFDMDNYTEGILYDPKGNIIYKGEFINNKPKEDKNIKLYDTNESLKYEGDLLIIFRKQFILWGKFF